MRARESQSPTPWLWIAAVWLAVALVNATQTVISIRAEGIQRPLGIFFVVNLLAWLPWALATPLVLWLAVRFPPNASPRIPTWSAHLAACVGLAMTHSIWITGLQWTLRPF